MKDRELRHRVDYLEQRLHFANEALARLEQQIGTLRDYLKVEFWSAPGLVARKVPFSCRSEE